MLGVGKRAGAAEFEDEVNHNGYVENEEDQFGNGSVMVDFPEFDGDEGGGHNDGEKLGPASTQG